MTKSKISHDTDENPFGDDYDELLAATKGMDLKVNIQDTHKGNNINTCDDKNVILEE